MTLVVVSLISNLIIIAALIFLPSRMHKVELDFIALERKVNNLKAQVCYSNLLLKAEIMRLEGIENELITLEKEFEIRVNELEKFTCKPSKK